MRLCISGYEVPLDIGYVVRLPRVSLTLDIGQFGQLRMLVS